MRNSSIAAIVVGFGWWLEEREERDEREGREGRGEERGERLKGAFELKSRLGGVEV